MVNHPLYEGKIFFWIKERSSPHWGFLTAVSSLKHSKLIKAIVANKSTKGSQVHETKSKRCESNHRNALKTSPKWRPLFVRSRFIEIKNITKPVKTKMVLYTLVPTIAKANALDTTWLEYIGGTWCRSGGENEEM